MFVLELCNRKFSLVSCGQEISPYNTLLQVKKGPSILTIAIDAIVLVKTESVLGVGTQTGDIR